jgi:NAD-dependent dihydropyrimidine dehydrogenase PreA subunit
MDVIRIDGERGKATIAYPEECTLCALCEIECPVGAIYVSPKRDVPMPTCFGV